MREDAFFESGEEDVAEFEALGAVHRHQRHVAGLFVERIEVANERDIRQEARNRRFGIVRFVLASDADQFLQILNACAGVVRFFGLQFANVAGLFHDGDEEIGDAHVVGLFAEVADQAPRSARVL